MKDLEFRSRAGMIDGDARFGSCNLCSSKLHSRFFTWSSRCVLELLGCATCQGGAWLGYVFFVQGLELHACMLVIVNGATLIETTKILESFYGDLQEGTPNFRKAVNSKPSLVVSIFCSVMPLYPHCP